MFISKLFIHILLWLCEKHNDRVSTGHCPGIRYFMWMWIKSEALFCINACISWYVYISSSSIPHILQDEEVWFTSMVLGIVWFDICIPSKRKLFMLMNFSEEHIYISIENNRCSFLKWLVEPLVATASICETYLDFRLLIHHFCHRKPALNIIILSAIIW